MKSLSMDPLALLLPALLAFEVIASPIQTQKNHFAHSDSSGGLQSSETAENTNTNIFSNIASLLPLMFMSKKKKSSNVNDGSGEDYQLNCVACKFAFSALQSFAKGGSSEDDIANIGATVCNVFGIQKWPVCTGYMKKQKHVIYLALTTTDLDAETFCGVVLEGCGEPQISEWAIPVAPVSEESSVKLPMLPEPGSPVTRVLQITDVHVDPFYEEGSNANCGLPLCCRSSSGKVLRAADAAGYWGDIRNCDLPLRTLKKMLSHINETQEIDYVILTGDFPPADTWNNSRESVLSTIHLVLDIIYEYFKVPIYPALGNHESYPQDSFPFPDLKEESLSWLYDELSKTWSKWLPDSAQSTIKKGGYYSVLVNPGFRIISLNMNYCNNLNWWLLLDSNDPTHQLAWLAAELQMAEENGEKVHIIGHIPPGDFACLGEWSSNYNKIINRFESTVTAQFFGHIHRDEFQIFYSKSENPPRPSNIAYIGPAVTPHYKNNPSYRIYTVDGDYLNSSRAVLDHETYYLNLTDANLTNNTEWKLEYSAKSAYNLSSLQPKEWDSLTRRFMDDDELFKKFYGYYTSLVDNGIQTCDKACKKKIICRLTRSQSNDPAVC